MGLRIKLNPNERIVINGAVIQNGDRASRLTVENHAQILREKDIMMQEDSRTPVRLVYFHLQMLIIDSQNDAHYRTILDQGFVDLARVIRNTEMREHLAVCAEFIAKGDLYKALMALKPVIEYENVLLGVPAMRGIVADGNVRADPCLSDDDGDDTTTSSSTRS